MKHKIALISEQASPLAALGGAEEMLRYIIDHSTTGVIEKIRSLEHEHA